MPHLFVTTDTLVLDAAFSPNFHSPRVIADELRTDLKR